MNLLIVGENMDLVRGGNPAYRGTCRSNPTHCDTIADEHSANVCFYWYLKACDESFVVHDLRGAANLVECYRSLIPPQEFEIIEVVGGNDQPQVGGTLIGFDLSCAFCNSLLTGGLDISSHRDPSATNKTLETMQPLFRLLETQFRPKLNENGLFDDFATASFCLECMMAMQALLPNLWEHEEYSDFEVVGVYQVSTR